MEACRVQATEARIAELAKIINSLKRDNGLPLSDFIVPHAPGVKAIQFTQVTLQLMFQYKYPRLCRDRVFASKMLSSRPRFETDLTSDVPGEEAD
jgi:hypothetical protein